MKTFVHLKDDKGWEEVEEREGDWTCGSSYFVPKRVSAYEVLSHQCDIPHPTEANQKYYEFEFRRERFEPLDEKGKTVAKHLFFEMR